MRKKKTFTIAVLLILILTVAGVVTYCNGKTQKAAMENDYSRLSWTAAFEELHQIMSHEYAFTDWKGIDWNQLYREYQPQIENAEKNSDFNAYYIALRSYLNQIPDGHVRVNNLEPIDDLYIGGGFGLAVAQLDDGRIIASWVDEAGPAWTAGIRPGAELVLWNGQQAKQAVEAVSTVFAGTSATSETLQYKKLTYLVRAPINDKVEIEYLNPDSTEKAAVTLIAYDDQRESLKKNYPDSVVSNKIRDMFVGVENSDPVPESMVETRIINNDITYIKIYGEIDADLQETGTTQSTLDLFRSAVAAAKNRGSRGLILDLRSNIGGLDNMTADILGSFYSEKTFFEYQNMYNPETGKFEIQMAESDSQGLYIKPADVCYNGQIIALINNKCVSSGEGLAMGIKNLPNGETLGFYGTNGSFGLAGSEAEMPGGLTVHWPSGQSLDENKRIQLDSQNGVGGVSPSIRIPITTETAPRIANGEDVELEEAISTLNFSMSGIDQSD